MSRQALSSQVRLHAEAIVGNAQHEIVPVGKVRVEFRTAGMANRIADRLAADAIYFIPNDRMQIPRRAFD